MEWTSTLLGVWWRNVHKRKGQLKVQPSHAQVRSKKIKILTEGFFLPEEKTTTNLQTDPVLWICLLALRRSEHWRDGGWGKEKESESDGDEHTWTEGWGRGHPTVKRQRRKQMIPPPGSESREVKHTSAHTQRHTQCAYILYLNWHFPHDVPVRGTCDTVQRIEDYIISLCSQTGKRKHTQFCSDALQSLAGCWLDERFSLNQLD